MAAVSFEIVTPQGLAFQREVYEVILPTPEGYIAVLPHHVPLVSLIASGVISVRHQADDSDEQLEHFATIGGFAEINGTRVRLLTDTAEHADSINELQAQEALERARTLRRQARDQVGLAEAVGLLEQSAARLKVAELRRRSARRPTPQ